MKISKIDIFQLDLPLEKPKKYPNKTYEAIDDTIIRIQTDDGLVGWSESCPLPTGYQAEHALGVRASLEEICPGLIGQDPTQIDSINERMNQWMMGGQYAKSALDIACWDLTGKAYNKPVYHLIGGRMQEKAKCYPEIEMGPVDVVPRRIEQYRQEGHTHFQLKAARGSEFELDLERITTAAECIRRGETLVVDANKGWKTHEALRILKKTEHVDYYIEQPCLTYEECLAIRPKVRQPMILDECMEDINVMLRALADNLFEGIGCKISRVGGISGMRLIRDVCKATGKVLTCDDSWGAQLSAAATTHMAMSTHPKTFFATYISSYFGVLCYDTEAPAVVDGFIWANDKPGLGVNPDMAILGEPIRTFT